VNAVNERPEQVIVAVRIEDTRYWCDNIRSKVKHIYGVYLYDQSVVTCCCEVTPSYCMIPIDLVAGEYPDDDDARDRLYSDLREAMWENDTDSYMHCRSVDRLPEESKRSIEIQLDEEEGSQILSAAKKTRARATTGAQHFEEP